MNAKELRNLQEAYLDVYEAVDDEGRAYRKPTGAGGRPIVRTELPDHMKSPKPRPVMTYAERRKKEASKTPEQKEAERQKRMKLAQSLLRQPQKEQVDLYDIILSRLLDEGYAETVESAQAIMVNMSEDWRDEIVEAKADTGLSDEEKEDARNARKFGTSGKGYFNPRGTTELRRGLHKSRRGMTKQDERRWAGEK